MKFHHVIGGAGLAILLVACSPVELKQPFPPDPKHPDRETLSGVWQSGNGFMHVTFSTNGTGRFAIPEWKGDEFKVDRGEFTLASASQGRYFTARMFDPAGDSDPAWSLGSYRINDDAVIFYWAKPDPFARSVAAGGLGGEVRTNNGLKVLLRSPPTDVLKFITEHESEDLFDYRNPGVFHRVAR